MVDSIVPQSGIYAIRNKINGKQYIGSTIHFENRFSDHKKLLRRGAHHSRRLQAAWKKYGEEVFEFLVIEAIPDVANLIDAEQRWIDLLNPHGNGGYNVLPKAGSRLGSKRTLEQVAAFAAKIRGTKQSADWIAKRVVKNRGQKRTEEQCAKLREALARARAKRIENLRNGASGVPRSEETRQKIREKALGRRHSDEARRKMSEARTGKKLSAEHVANAKAGLLAALARKKALAA